MGFEYFMVNTKNKIKRIRNLAWKLNDEIDNLRKELINNNINVESIEQAINSAKDKIESIKFK